MTAHGTATGAAELALERELAQQLRVDAIRCTTAAGSGHPTSAMSAADLIAVLLSRHLRYDWSRPHHAGNDTLVFSKGHASVLLYACLKAVGAIDDAELLSYRRHGSRLQGHATPALPWVPVATGSLGQGLPIAVGMAIADRLIAPSPRRTWVLCGDGELAEGSMWEAADKAAAEGLSNLVALVDVNRLGQTGETAHGWDLRTYGDRFQAFGWRTHEIDGHDLRAVDQALGEARDRPERPTAILARTIKGMGVAEIADRTEWHGKALPRDVCERAIVELGGERDLRVSSPPPGPAPAALGPAPPTPSLPAYGRGDRVAVRVAAGEALRAIGGRPDVVVIDGDLCTSTFTQLFAEAYPERFLQMHIAEQQMVAAAVGLAQRGLRPFAVTYAAFLSRAYDFVRMAAVSGAGIKLIGSHGGVEIGPEGPSQMGLEDIASMRAVEGSTVLYPSDATSAAKLVAIMADTPGVVYLRTTRNPYPVLYGEDEDFRIGGSRVVLDSPEPDVALIGAGVTLHQCREAARVLEPEGIALRVIDLYSVKPVDRETLRRAAADTAGRLVVVEDHYPAGGLGSAVLEALGGEGLPLRVVRLAVRGLPASGRSDEMLRAAGISSGDVAAAVRRLVVERPRTVEMARA